MSVETFDDVKFTKCAGGVSFDDRGYLRHINDFDMSEVKRFYQVENHKKGFIRAWHGHKEEAKWVYVASGSIILGVVDMEQVGKKTPRVAKIYLSAVKPEVVYIPASHYNGFMNLEDNTKVIFFSDKTFEEAKNDDIRMPHDTWDIWSIESR